MLSQLRFNLRHTRLNPLGASLRVDDSGRAILGVDGCHTVFLTLGPLHAYEEGKWPYGRADPLLKALLSEAFRRGVLQILLAPGRRSNTPGFLGYEHAGMSSLEVRPGDGNPHVHYISFGRGMHVSFVNGRLMQDVEANDAPLPRPDPEQLPPGHPLKQRWEEAAEEQEEMDSDSDGVVLYDSSEQQQQEEDMDSDSDGVVLFDSSGEEEEEEDDDDDDDSVWGAAPEGVLLRERFMYRYVCAVACESLSEADLRPENVAAAVHYHVPSCQERGCTLPRGNVEVLGARVEQRPLDPQQPGSPLVDTLVMYVPRSEEEWRAATDTDTDSAAVVGVRPYPFALRRALHSAGAMQMQMFSLMGVISYRPVKVTTYTTGYVTKALHAVLKAHDGRLGDSPTELLLHEALQVLYTMQGEERYAGGEGETAEQRRRRQYRICTVLQMKLANRVSKLVPMTPVQAVRDILQLDNYEATHTAVALHPDALFELQHRLVRHRTVARVLADEEGRYLLSMRASEARQQAVNIMFRPQVYSTLTCAEIAYHWERLDVDSMGSAEHALWSRTQVWLGGTLYPAMARLNAEYEAAAHTQEHVLVFRVRPVQEQLPLLQLRGMPKSAGGTLPVEPETRAKVLSYLFRRDNQGRAVGVGRMRVRDAEAEVQGQNHQESFSQYVELRGGSIWRLGPPDAHPLLWAMLCVDASSGQANATVQGEQRAQPERVRRGQRGAARAAADEGALEVDDEALAGTSIDGAPVGAREAQLVEHLTETMLQSSAPQQEQVPMDQRYTSADVDEFLLRVPAGAGEEDEAGDDDDDGDDDGGDGGDRDGDDDDDDDAEDLLARAENIVSQRQSAIREAARRGGDAGGGQEEEDEEEEEEEEQQQLDIGQETVVQVASELVHQSEFGVSAQRENRGLLVPGGAGVGKSHLLPELRRRLRQALGTDEDPVCVVAPTHSLALALQGYTIDHLCGFRGNVRGNNKHAKSLLLPTHIRQRLQGNRLVALWLEEYGMYTPEQVYWLHCAWVNSVLLVQCQVNVKEASLTEQQQQLQHALMQWPFAGYACFYTGDSGQNGPVAGSVTTPGSTLLAYLGERDRRRMPGREQRQGAELLATAQRVVALFRNFRFASCPELLRCAQSLREGDTSEELAQALGNRWLGSPEIAYQLPAETWDMGAFAVHTNEARLAGSQVVVEQLVAHHNLVIRWYAQHTRAATGATHRQPHVEYLERVQQGFRGEPLLMLMTLEEVLRQGVSRELCINGVDTVRLLHLVLGHRAKQVVWAWLQDHARQQPPRGVITLPRDVMPEAAVVEQARGALYTKQPAAAGPLTRLALVKPVTRGGRTAFPLTVLCFLTRSKLQGLTLRHGVVLMSMPSGAQRPVHVRHQGNADG